MKDITTPAWDGRLGTAGGAAFGAALRKLAEAASYDAAALAQATDLSAHLLEAVFKGEERLAVSALARIAQATRLKAIEFMQKTGLLSLEVYAFGLDPLYFLPEGQLRYDARIYMREINPRHAVPEADMIKRNPAMKALADDVILDSLGKLELEMAYLLRTAVQQTGGTL
ncbi:MAG: helix-turn-helix domain-containing protein [Candidatus Eremiobacteraeota bacterium]|nr:helix-turn-helix domain-containing protein [Candidatus Eremiobacteraeota bacterium]